MSDYYIQLDSKDIEKIEVLDEKTKSIMSDFVSCGYYPKMICILNKCESPIEKILAAQLYHEKLLLCMSNIIWAGMKIKPQYEINIDTNKYRVDFFIECQFNAKLLSLVVECDGHDFHEKTKEQAIKDKKRDRDLIKAGYKVIHFTGSEIYKDSYKCVVEIMITLGVRNEG